MQRDAFCTWLFARSLRRRAASETTNVIWEMEAICWHQSLAAGIAVNRDINPAPVVMGEDTRGVLSLRSVQYIGVLPTNLSAEKSCRPLDTKQAMPSTSIVSILSIVFCLRLVCRTSGDQLRMCDHKPLLTSLSLVPGAVQWWALRFELWLRQRATLALVAVS